MNKARLRIEHERELRLLSEKAIDHERELRRINDEHERELRMVAESAVEKARQIQFDEYERRLEALNHAHEQHVATLAVTVTRIEFDQFKKDLSDRQSLAAREVTLKHEALEGRVNAFDVLVRSLVTKDDLSAAIDRLNTTGTEGYRETEAARAARESVQRETLSASKNAASESATNRRWLVTITITIIGIAIANTAAFLGLILHAAHVF